MVPACLLLSRWPDSWQGPAGLRCPDPGPRPAPRLLNAAPSYRENWKNTGRPPHPQRAGRPRFCGWGLLPGRRWPRAGKRGRRPACQRERARARVSAAPAPRRPRRRPPGLLPPPAALPAAWQAAGCTGGGSRRSHDLSGCLSSSGSYSFPARKQPGLLSEPPWPQGRRAGPVWPPWAAPARPRSPRPPRNPEPPWRARGGGSSPAHLVALRSPEEASGGLLPAKGCGES